MAATIPVKTTKKSGANACIPTAVAHWPLIIKAMAVVNPHPGQVMPKVDLIGHCHPFNPLTTSISWVRPTPRNMPINQRFNSNGASTGVKNHSKCRDLSVSPERAGFPGCPYAGLYDSTILAISTCK